MKPSLSTRIIRFLLLILLFAVLRRIPKQFFLIFLESSGIILVVGSLLISWHKLMKWLRGKSSLPANRASSAKLKS